MDKDSNLDYDFADIITERPHEFTVGRKHFRLYPVTLAKTFVLGRIIGKLPIDKLLLAVNPYVEALRLVEVDKESCCHILAIHTTPNTYKDLYNTQSIACRKNVFASMGNKSIASLLLYVLTSDKTDALMEHLGIDAERVRLRKAMEVKDTKNSLSFGGKTLFGGFIGPLKEMGYTDDEILFERGYTYLRLMLADKVTSVYVTDEELNSLPADMGGKVLDGNDPGSFSKLQSIFADKGVTIN